MRAEKSEHGACDQTKIESDTTRKGGIIEHTNLKVNEAGLPPGLSEVVGISQEYI